MIETDIEGILLQTADPFARIREFIPAIIIGSVVVLVILMILVAVSAVGRWRVHKANLAMQQDIRAIRELLEEQKKLRYGYTTPQPTAPATNDPQLPPLP